MKKVTKFVILVLVVFNFSALFAIWADNVASSQKSVNPLVEIGAFNYGYCLDNIFVADDIFYNKYFVMKNGKWQRKPNLTQAEVNEVGEITKDYAFVKTDTVYRVMQKHYHMYHNNLPFLTETYLSWAVEPVGLEIVSGWSYLPNRVITFQGNYYRSYHTINGTPSQYPYAWERINKIETNDFAKFDNSCVENFYQPKSQALIRPYVWSISARYLAGDVVKYQGLEYECLFEVSTINPTNTSFWVQIWKSKQ